MGRNNRSITPSVETVAREAKVVQLRRAKLDWTTIATEVGLNSPQAAQRIFRRAISRVNVAQVDELRREESEVLDRLHAAYWRQATNGDVAAGLLILKVFEQRAKLWGLYAPTKSQVEVTDSTRQRLVELVDQIRALPPAEDEHGLTRDADVIDSTAYEAHALPAGASKYNRSNEIPG